MRVGGTCFRAFGRSFAEYGFEAAGAFESRVGSGVEPAGAPLELLVGEIVEVLGVHEADLAEELGPGGELEEAVPVHRLRRRAIFAAFRRCLSTADLFGRRTIARS